MRIGHTDVAEPQGGTCLGVNGYKTSSQDYPLDLFHNFKK